MTPPTDCWAAPLGDCDQKISREHLVSECLFESDQLMVQGFDWCLNEPKSIGLSSLVRKNLCRKHNSRLSDLDSAALHAFNVFRKSIDLNHVREKIKRPPLWNVKRLKIDGPLLERWFLKTLINVCSGEKWRIGLGSHRKGTPSKELVEIAFGLRCFTNGGGLYITSRAGEQIDSMDRVSVQPLTEAENVAAGRFNFRGYRFFLSLVPEKFNMDGNSHLMHQQTTFRCLVQERLSHVIYIKGW
jgi:hypothetical protein